MAAVDKKISQLTTLVDATSNDYFVVVDRSEPNVDIRTKKIILADLMGNPGPIGVRNPSSIEAISITLVNTVDEFSTDGNLTGNSDTALPTEKAVKAYVDGKISGIDEHNELRNIQGGLGGDATTAEHYHLTLDSYEGIYSAPLMIGIGSEAGTNMEIDRSAGNILFQGDLGAGQQAILEYNESSAFWKLGNQNHTYIYLREMDDASDGSIRLFAGDDILFFPTNDFTTRINSKDVLEVFETSTVFSPNNVESMRIEENQLTVTGDADVTGDVHIYGDAIIDGTTFVVNTAVITAEDPVITVNSGETGAGVTAGEAGILVDRGSAQNYKFIFDETDDRFKVGFVGSEKLVLTGQAGNESLSLGDSTSIVVFATAEDDVNYSVTWSLVYEGGSTPSIYSGTVFDKLTTGFSVIFSGPMDTNDYVLSWIITR